MEISCFHTDVVIFYRAWGVKWKFVSYWRRNTFGVKVRGAGKSIKGEFKRSEFKREVPLSVNTISSLPGKHKNFLRYYKLISLTTSDGQHLNKWIHFVDNDGENCVGDKGAYSLNHSNTNKLLFSNKQSFNLCCLWLLFKVLSIIWIMLWIAIKI